MTELIQNFDNMRFGNLIGLTARIWRKTIDSRLKNFQLTEAMWLPLVYLEKQPSSIYQKDLAAMLSLDSSSLVRVLNNLEKLGFVERITVEHDRRAKATAITRQGREVVYSIEKISLELQQEILSELNIQDYQVTRKTLQKICEGLQHLNKAEL